MTNRCKITVHKFYAEFKKGYADNILYNWYKTIIFAYLKMCIYGISGITKAQSLKYARKKIKNLE